MSNILPLTYQSDDLKAQLVVTEQFIDGMKHDFEGFMLVNEDVSDKLTQQVNALMKVKTSFRELGVQLNVSASEIEQQLALIESPLHPVIQQFEEVEQEIIHLQSRSVELMTQFNCVHDQVYGLDVIAGFENEQSLAEIVLDLTQQLVAITEEKERQQIQLNNQVNILECSFNSVQNEFNRIMTEFKQRQEPLAQSSERVNVNEELTLALANSLQQNRLLEHKLIKAQAQIDILKELMSGSFSLK